MEQNSKVSRFIVRIGQARAGVAGGLDKVFRTAWKAVKSFFRTHWPRWRRMVVRIAAIGTTVTGAVAAASTTSSITGIAMGTASATGGFVAAQGIPVRGYEKIKHVSPKAGRASMLSVPNKPPSAAAGKRAFAPKMTGRRG